MKSLTPTDQNVLRLLSEGARDHDICREMKLSALALRKSIQRIKARAAVESDDAGRFYERALRKQASNRVTALEARFHALMDILPQAVLIVDGRSGEIKEFNQKACDLFAYDARTLRRKKIEELMSADLQALHVKYRIGFLQSVRKRQMGYHPPISGLRSDGTEIPMSIALTATSADDDVMAVCTELAADQS